MAKLYRIEICRFQREENSDWEIGLLLNEGDLGILARDGSIPSEVWTWERNTSFAVEIGDTMDRLETYELIHLNLNPEEVKIVEH